MDLLHQSQTDNEEAFAALFHKYKNLIYKTAYLMLGNAEDAEDALQEVFVHVYKSLSAYQPSKGAFTTWLYRITVNYCLNRRRKRHLPVLSLDEVPSTLQIGASPAFEDQLADEKAIRQALGHLSAKLRPVVILRYYWELSYAEIAQILEVPIGTVKSRLDLALKALRKELERARENIFVPLAFVEREVKNEMSGSE